jgi:hypothetical protein
LTEAPPEEADDAAAEADDEVDELTAYEAVDASALEAMALDATADATPAPLVVVTASEAVADDTTPVA